MPRTWIQGAAFLLGFWLALWLSPLRVEVARADGEDALRTALEDELYRDVNDLRQQQHLIPLRRVPELDRVARAHSADMAKRHYLSHENPEGENPVDRIRRAGIDGFSLAAENAGQTDRGDPARAIVAGWLGSPDHRRNLHAPPFNTTGVGVARAADGTWYFTQLYLTYPRP